MVGACNQNAKHLRPQRNQQIITPDGDGRDAAQTISPSHPTSVLDSIMRYVTSVRKLVAFRNKRY